MEIKNNIYQIISLFVVIILCLIGFLVWPLLQDIKNNSGKILSDNAKALFVETEIKELDAFEKKYVEYEPHLRKIEGVFVDVKNPIDFIRFLEKIALDSEVSIEINLLPEQKSSINGVLPSVFFQIYITGDFVNILKFSERMEFGDYLIMVNSMTIKKVSKNQDAPSSPSGKVDAEFLVEIMNK